MVCVPGQDLELIKYQICSQRPEDRALLSLKMAETLPTTPSTISLLLLLMIPISILLIIITNNPSLSSPSPSS